jgi:hypothetical protein
MLELLVGILIFSLAILPMLVFSHSSTRGTYSIGKHLKAGTLVASLMDRLLALPYDECLAEALDLEKRGDLEVMADPLFQQVLATSGEINPEEFQRSFRFFRYKVMVFPGRGGEADQMFIVGVEVSWRIEDGSEGSRQSLDLHAIKFREHI